MIVESKIVAEELAQGLASLAVEALLEELHLTPKPGLVDRMNSGTHRDLSFSLMEISARTLRECFYEMAMAGIDKQPSQHLREQLAAIGRYGEEKMLRATGQVNTHRGAIWALGLITGATAVLVSQQDGDSITHENILTTAGAIAGFEDGHAPLHTTNGSRVRERYQVRSAREEAMAGFPSLRNIALPAWYAHHAEPLNIRKLNVLLSLMAVTDDTCVLHRSDMEVLCEVKRMAGEIIAMGGMGYYVNWQRYHALDKFIQSKWVSPGGSADLLAATLFLQKITHHY